MIDAAEAPKTSIILSSRDAVAEFLAAHPNPDEAISWTCPECNAINPDAYHSHRARCGACGKGHFPAIHLPIVGDAKTSVKRAFMNDRLFQIEQNIEEAKDRIRDAENEIEEAEHYIRELTQEKLDIEHDLMMGVEFGGEEGSCV